MSPQYGGAPLVAGGKDKNPCSRKQKKRANRPPLKRLHIDIRGAVHPSHPGFMSPNSLLSHFCSSDSSTSSQTSDPGSPQPLSSQLAPSLAVGRVYSPTLSGRRSPWDDLEDRVLAADAAGYPHKFDDDAYALFQLLDSEILSTRKAYRKLLHYKGRMAQLLIDALQWILHVHSSFEPSRKRKFMQALIRLARRSSMLPRAYLLQVEDIDVGSVMFQSMSVDIYRGTHRGHPVCLKKYRGCNRSRNRLDASPGQPQMTEISIREAILWANCRHPGLLPFEGVYRANEGVETTHLVSPFLQSGTIVDHLEANPDGVDRRLLVRDVLRTMAYLHANNIVHGDIKGCNVLVDDTGHAVLADLGLSRLNDEELLTWMSVQTSSPSAGTLPWLAPEILGLIKAQQPVAPTAASDVYALGCLIYEVFTGQSPFHELARGCHYVGAHYRISTEVLHGKRPLKPAPNTDPYLRYGLTEDIWKMMEACWERDVKARPTVHELLKTPCMLSLVDHRPIMED